MPGPSIRVAGAHVDFSARSDRYEAGIQRVLNSNRQFTLSQTALTGVLGRFQQSVTSSIIATAAYATGIGLLTRAFTGSNREFLDFERNLVAVQKTADLTNAQTERLGRGIRRLVTETSSLGQPLPIAREELERIAVVAGQMNIRGTRDILAFTETVGLLTLTTDLAGDAAANAIGKIIATTQSGVSEIQNLGASLTALGNAFRGGESDIISQATFLATQTAAFRLPTQTVLGLSAVLSAGGQRPETAGTAFARVLQSLTDAAAELVNDGNFEKLAVVTRNLSNDIDGTRESAEELANTILSGNYTQAISTFIEALSNTGADERGNIFTTLLGGDVVPTRVAGIFNFLVENAEEVTRALDLAGLSWEEALATIEEAGRFAEARALRFVVVQNQLRDQALEFGDILSRIFINIGEFVGGSFNVIQTGLTGLLAAVGTRFVTGRIQAAREVNRLQRESLMTAVQEAREARDLNRVLLARSQTTAREVQAGNRAFRNAAARRQSELADRRRLRGELNTIRNLRQGAQTRFDIQAQQTGPLARVGGARRQLDRLLREEEQIQSRFDAAGRRIAETRATIVQGRQIYRDEDVVRTEQNLAAARDRNADSTRRLGNEQRRLNNFLTRGQTLVARFGRGLLNFLGGPLGIINLAIVGGITAWQIWGESVDEAQADVDDLIQRMDDLIQRQNQLASGRSEEGLAIDASLRGIGVEEDRLEDLVSRLATAERRRVEISVGQQLFDDAEIESLQEQINQVETNIANLTDRVATLRQGIRGIADEWEGFGDAVDRSVVEFRNIDLRLAGAGDSAREFTRNLRNEIRSQNREFDTRFYQINASPLDQLFIQRREELRNRANDALEEAERRADFAAEVVSRVADSYAEAVTLRDRLTGQEPGSDQVRAAVNQVNRIESALNTARSNLVLAQATAEAQRSATEAALEGAELEAQNFARRSRTLDILERLSERTRRVYADVSAEQTRAAEELRSENRRIGTIIRDQNQQREIAIAGPIEGAGLEAEFAVRNRRSERLAAATDRVTAAYERRAVAESLLTRTRMQFFGANDSAINGLVDRVLALQNTVEQERANIVSAIAYRNAILDQGDAWEFAASSAGRYARDQARINQQIQQRPAFIDVAEQQRLAEQALANLTRQSSRSLRDTVQESAIAALSSEGQQAGLEAYFSVLNNYEDQLQSIRDEIALTSQAIRDDSRTLESQERILNQLAGTIGAIGAREDVDQTRSRIAASQRERSELSARLYSLLNLAGGYQNLARILMELARTQEQVNVRFTDAAEQIRIVEERFDDLARGVSSRGREIRQESIINALTDPTEQAGLSAYFAVINQYEDSIQSIRDQIDLTNRAISDDERNLGIRQRILDNAIGTNTEEGNRRIVQEIKDRIEANQGLSEELQVQLDATLNLRAGVESLAEEARDQEVAATSLQRQIESLTAAYSELYDEQRFAQRQFRSFSQDLNRQIRGDIQQGILGNLDPISAARLSSQFNAENTFDDNLLQVQNELRDTEEDIIDLRAERAILEEKRNTAETEGIRAGLSLLLLQTNAEERAALNLRARLQERVDFILAQEDAYRRAGAAAGQFYADQERARQDRILEEPFPIEFPDFAAQTREAERQIQDAIRRFETSRRDALQRAQVEDEASPLAALRLESRFEIANQQADSLADANDRLADTERRLADEIREAARLDGLKSLSIGKRRLEIIQLQRQQQITIRSTANEILEIRRLIAALESLGGRYSDVMNSADELAAFLRQRQIRAIFDNFQQPEPPDISAQRESVASEIRELQNELFRGQREAEQQALLQPLSAVPRAGAAARFEVTNEREDVLIRARQELSDVNRRLSESTTELSHLQDAFRFTTDANINAAAEELVQKRESIAQDRKKIIELEALISFMEAAEEETNELADAFGRLAESQVSTPLRELALSAQNLDDIINGVTANALTNFENALVNVFRTGRLELDNLIEAIAIDLIQALIRATITANLARVALQAIGFIFGGGGTGAGLEADFGIAHSGGIVGNLERRRLSAPLRPSEELAVLERGEEVITRRDPRHRWNIGMQSPAAIRAWATKLPRYHEGGVVGGGGGPGSGGGYGMPNLTINIENQTGRPLDAQDNGFRFDGDQYVRSVILRDLRNNGPLAQNLRRTTLGSRG